MPSPSRRSKASRPRPRSRLSGPPGAAAPSLFLGDSQKKIRGSVNGNVLIPRPDERTALAANPAARAIVECFPAAYPAGLPNRTDINERALNTNAPQASDDNNAEIRLDQLLGACDRLSFHFPPASIESARYSFRRRTPWGGGN